MSDKKQLDFQHEEIGKSIIYRTYSDTEVASLWVNVQCPYCGHEDRVLDMDICGTTYTIECDECEKDYDMYFDAD